MDRLNRELELIEMRQRAEAAEQQLADAKAWIATACGWAFSHKDECPRSVEYFGKVCSCGLDEFLTSPEPVVESFKSQLVLEHSRLSAMQTDIAALRTDLELAVGERDRMKAALRGLMGFIERGHLVRNIADDGEPGWAMQALELVVALKAADAALAPATGRGGSDVTSEEAYWAGLGPEDLEVGVPTSAERRSVMARANNAIYDAATEVLKLESVTRPDVIAILERCARELRAVAAPEPKEPE